MELVYGAQRVSVAAGEYVIGSEPGAALRLTGDSLLPRHAVVQASGGHPVIRAAVPGAVVAVNGASIGADPTPLLHGDRIAVAGHEIIVTDPVQAGATRAIATARPTAPSLPFAGPSGPAAALGEPTGRLVSLTDGREYQVAVAPFVLGRDAEAQIVIGSPDASRRHAEIVSLPDGDVLVDLSANGTYVNGQRVANRHRLKALDVIRIGSEEFRYYPVPKPVPVGAPAGAEFRLGDTLMGLPSFKTPAAPVPAVERPLAHVRVKGGAAKGQRFAVRTAVVNIGRAEFNDVRLPDPSVSSSHAKILLREGVWSLTDLGSTNGTTVDGLTVTEEVALSPGATITVGDVSLSFEPQDERPAAPARTTVLPKAVPAEPVPAEPAPSPRAEARPLPQPPRVAPGDAALNPPRPVPGSILPAEPVRRSNPVLLAGAIVVLIGALALLVLYF